MNTIGHYATDQYDSDPDEETTMANDAATVLKLVELFTRAALDGKGLGDRQCIEAVHDLVVPLVLDPIGYDQIALAGGTPLKHVCCGCGGLCDSGEPCPMAYNCKCRQRPAGGTPGDGLRGKGTP